MKIKDFLLEETYDSNLIEHLSNEIKKKEKLGDKFDITYLFKDNPFNRKVMLYFDRPEVVDDDSFGALTGHTKKIRTIQMFFKRSQFYFEDISHELRHVLDKLKQKRMSTTRWSYTSNYTGYFGDSYELNQLVNEIKYNAEKDKILILRANKADNYQHLLSIVLPVDFNNKRIKNDLHDRGFANKFLTRLKRESIISEKTYQRINQEYIVPFRKKQVENSTRSK